MSSRASRTLAFWVAIGLLFAFALSFRGRHMHESPLIVERHFSSSIIARAQHFTRTPSVAEWRRQVAESSSQRVGHRKEPPLMEALVAFAYRFVDGQPMWLPKLFASLLWLAGAAALYRIARRLGPPEAAAVSTAYFLFAPVGMEVTLSFVPESLMVLMLLLGVLAVLRYHEGPSAGRLAVAVATCAAAVLVKPFCLFAVLATFLLLAISRRPSWRAVFALDSAIFGLGVLGLGAAYYLHGMFLATGFDLNLRAGFLPMLFLSGQHWRDWLLTGSAAVGWAPLVGALLGFALLPKRPGWPLLAGLAVGYALFGAVYTAPFTVATYYHVQLAILVALGLGPLGNLLIQSLRVRSRPWRALALAAAAGVLVLQERELVERIRFKATFETPELAREIGEIVRHSTRTIHLASYYGNPLEYYGELSGTYWRRPRMNRDVIRYGLRRGAAEDPGLLDWLLRRPGLEEVGIRERLDALGFAPEYFVVTAFDDFDRNHRDVKEFLEAHCPLVASSDRYRIYGVEDCMAPREGAG